MAIKEFVDGKDERLKIEKKNLVKENNDLLNQLNLALNQSQQITSSNNELQFKIGESDTISGKNSIIMFNLLIIIKEN
jgi:hypothetical protein